MRGRLNNALSVDVNGGTDRHRHRQRDAAGHTSRVSFHGQYVSAIAVMTRNPKSSSFVSGRRDSARASESPQYLSRLPIESRQLLPLAIDLHLLRGELAAQNLDLVARLRARPARGERPGDEQADREVPSPRTLAPATVQSSYNTLYDENAANHLALGPDETLRSRYWLGPHPPLPRQKMRSGFVSTMTPNSKRAPPSPSNWRL